MTSLRTQLVASLYLTRIEKALAAGNARLAADLMEDRAQFSALPVETRIDLRSRLAAVIRNSFRVVGA